MEWTWSTVENIWPIARSTLAALMRDETVSYAAVRFSVSLARAQAGEGEPELAGGWRQRFECVRSKTGTFEPAVSTRASSEQGERGWYVARVRKASRARLRRGGSAGSPGDCLEWGQD